MPRKAKKPGPSPEVKPEPAKIGRPSSFTKEMGDMICERLLRGEPLARICDDPEMPAYTTVRNWEDQNPEFLALSTRARIDGTHYMADDCIKIADQDGLDPADKRIRIDTRLRLIGKWNRKVYGEKQEVEHSGAVTLASLVEASLPPKAG